MLDVSELISKEPEEVDPSLLISKLETINQNIDLHKIHDRKDHLVASYCRRSVIYGSLKKWIKSKNDAVRALEINLQNGKVKKIFYEA